MIWPFRENKFVLFFIILFNFSQFTQNLDVLKGYTGQIRIGHVAEFGYIDFKILSL